MAKDVDLDLLRQVTADSIHIYDALGRAQTLIAEGKRVVTMAEDLLRYAGLAYLLKDGDTGVNKAIDSSRAPQEMVSAHIQIQQSYTDLKDALYRLAKGYLEAKQWDDARPVMEALLKIEPQYRDVATLRQESILTHSKHLFEQEKWEEGLAVLRRWSGREKRLQYFCDFLRNYDLPVDGGLRALQQEEHDVSRISSFKNALECAILWRSYLKGMYSIIDYKKSTRYWLDSLQAEVSSLISSSSE